MVDSYISKALIQSETKAFIGFPSFKEDETSSPACVYAISLRKNQKPISKKKRTSFREPSCHNAAPSSTVISLCDRFNLTSNW